MSKFDDNFDKEVVKPQLAADNEIFEDIYEGVGVRESADEEQRPIKDLYAFGLDIDPETGLPRITSMGRGYTAQKMLEKATQSGVHVEKDVGTVRRMFTPLDDRVIPASTYGIIAEILTFIYQLNEAYAKEDIERLLEIEAGKIVQEAHIEEFVEQNEEEAKEGGFTDQGEGFEDFVNEDAIVGRETIEYTLEEIEEYKENLT